MDKKRLNTALSVLDAVRSRFPEKNEFIDSTLTVFRMGGGEGGGKKAPLPVFLL